MATDFDLAIIGCGNMGAALVSGYLKRAPDSRVLIVDPDLSRSKSLLPDAPGLVFSEDPSPLDGQRAALVILAIKPQSCSAALPGLSQTTINGSLLLSVVAGVRVAALQEAFPEARIVRCVPNTPALEGAGAAVLWAGPAVTEADRARCQALLEMVGSADWIAEEAHVDLGTAVSGSGPAYFFAFTEAVARAAEAIGMDPTLATKLARATAIGSAAMLEGQSALAGQLKAAVRSPAGTTDAALRIFERDDVLNVLVEQAITAAHRRAVELGAPPAPVRIRTVDMHTAGEPVRIVEDGYPELQGATILEKRRDALTRHDHLRRALMLEPRGHAGMYGVLPTAASEPEAAFGVLFTHQEGYSTMCGHATIAIGRWAVDTGRATLRNGKATFKLEVPCGVVDVEVTGSGSDLQVAFESVESFASHLDQQLDIPGFGPLTFDISFGGAYYVVIPASKLGLSLMDTPVAELVQAGVAITNAVRAAIPITHPTEPDLGFLYGTILTDDVPIGASAGQPSYNLCIFAEGQIDRSPTGSGVTARIALAAAKGEMEVGQSCEIRGVSGQGFQGTLSRSVETEGGLVSRVKVGGRAYYAARNEFLLEPHDPFADGFELPMRFSDLPA